ncbi:MAG: hypothetical protein AMXMBFR23_28520 [Chloroflexota bacterium]
MRAPATKGISYAEYLALERTTGVRHEFASGTAWAMAGGSVRHSAIKTNLTALFRGALRDTPSRPYDSDLKVRVLATGLATYPDLSVVCGRPQLDPEDGHAVTNPTLLVEVLSPDTEAWDRGGRFAHYRRIPSLRHYLLVSQDVARIEHYELLADGSWRLTEHGAGQAIPLSALSIELPVDPVYEDLPPEGPPP